MQLDEGNLLKRPSSREEDKRAQKAIHRSKPDAYKTSSSDDSSSSSEDEESYADSDYSAYSEVPEQVFKSDDENVITDTAGKPLFNPDKIKHPRSAEWVWIAKYLEYWLRKLLDQTARNKLRAECPRPTLAKKKKVAQTLDLDPP
ncbi:Hypothetical predicted protein [Pelobates cultripes]|uniref:Uncharacterized protein n=1 Tax=Pelobates cultripes TaxID=61616 RepID=A0AAD1RCB9_PELCU|nr:Hypothetical predicted protein [Pelobates cultripes]